MKLYELLGHEDRRYSQFSWRIRMALRHKGLDVEYVPVKLTDKEAIAFSGGTTVPVLVDGDTVLRESWDIAIYLEDRYPETPMLGDAIGRGVTRMIQNWADRTLNAAVGPMICRDVVASTHADDRDYLQASMEKMYKRPLDEVQGEREKNARTVYITLNPVRQTVREQPFLAGQAPAYADFVVFSILQWARICSPYKLIGDDDPVRGWRERMLDLYGGYARDTVACKEAA